MRYIIGIDLGTTNSSVAYVDTHKPPLALQLFAIPQLVSSGRIESLWTLPSFCYLIGQEEWPSGALRLPWGDAETTIVGQLAKMQGARVPTRLIQSAKSWLCHVAANRQDKILPLEIDELSLRLSPVEASAKYLTHIREAWNAAIAKGDVEAEFAEQDIILTVPASFDEVARALTVEAARLAGLNHVTLLEEPQAAFYSWIAQHEKNSRLLEAGLLKKGDSILICDVGGGTTDFSLIEVQGEEEKLTFQRMSVGDHLLLGGDNMDIALAHYLEQKLQEQGHSLHSTSQWLQLKAEARLIKEELLSEGAHPETSKTIVIQGTGSSVIRGSLSIAIQRAEVEKILVEGFFGNYSVSEALQRRPTQGFRTVGLPYEDEPSITKHMAHFLQQAGYFAPGRAIQHLLFNGGALKPIPFQKAIELSLRQWFPDQPLDVLPSVDLDLAVARGAAYYGKARRGLGIVVGGGTARTYYLEIEMQDEKGQLKKKALTLLPRGIEEGTSYQAEQIFALRPNQPVAFHLLTSHVRLHDQQGSLIDIEEEEMHRLPPIRTVLRFGRKQSEQQELIPVRLSIKLTAIGTIELWLQSQKTDHQWHLEFQLRSAEGHDSRLWSDQQRQKDETFDTGYLEEAQQIVRDLFTASIAFKPNQVMEKLEEALGIERKDWSPSVLRGLWEPLLQTASHRKKSLELEARWWNLVGFCLRPGFGFPLDDFRIKELWKIILQDLKTLKAQECLIQMWICFRRIAGGLNKGQQIQVASELMADLFNKRTGQIEVKGRSELYAYSEKIRALAALERLDIPMKIRLGDALMKRINQKEAAAFDYWALGRLGARHLIYGSAGQVVPKDVCAKWIEMLLLTKGVHEKESLHFVLAQLARRTDQRELNMPESLIQRILEEEGDMDLKERLQHNHGWTLIEQEQIFGDRLPSGLVLENRLTDG